MKNETLYLNIINNLCDGVYFVDTERRITFWNDAAEQITGYKREDMVGKKCQDNLLSHIGKDGTPLCMLACPLFETVVDGVQRRDEVFLRHKDGHRIPISVNIFPMEEDGKIVGAIEIFTPTSPIIYEDELIEKLSNMAMHDQLTGVANRRKMESYISYRLHELKSFNSKFCVVFLDIDNFGAFNNTYGHEAGDEVLKTVCRSVNSSVRAEDLFGRWGGEEFIGVFKVKKEGEAVMLAEKIRVLIERSEVQNGSNSLSVTASLGVTLALPDDTVQSVVERADTLMYRSKKSGKNRVTADIAT